MKTMKRFAIPAMAVLFALAVMPVFAQNDQAPRNPNTMLENPGVGPNIPPAAEAGAQSEPPVPGRGRGMRDGRGMGQGQGYGRGARDGSGPGRGLGFGGGCDPDCPNAR